MLACPANVPGRKSHKHGNATVRSVRRARDQCDAAAQGIMSPAGRVSGYRPGLSHRLSAACTAANTAICARAGLQLRTRAQLSLCMTIVTDDVATLVRVH